MSFVFCGIARRLFVAALTALFVFSPRLVVGQDEIVVTGERRAQPANRAPASLTLIREDTLRNVNADHVSEILSRVPGVSLHRGSGAEQLTAIRSPVLTGGAGAGSFLFLQDGVPLRSPGFANINGLLDAQYETASAIEVVRGPSGPLYGANAIHGVVNVLSPDYSDQPTAFLDIFGDSEDRFKWKGTGSTVIDFHELAGAFSVTSEAGYRRDAGLDQQKVTLRHGSEFDGVSLDTIFAFHNLEQETAGFIFGEEALNDRERRRDNEFPFAYRDAKSARLQSTIAISAGAGEELRITPYARWNQMEFPQHFLPSNALENNDHWSVGLQSAYYWDRERFSLIAGVDAEYTEGYLREFQSDPTIFSFTQGLHYEYRVSAINASGFADATYRLGEQWRIKAGVRVDGTIYDYDNRTDDGVVGRFLRPPDRTDRFITASPKISILRSLGDDRTVYASYARGARPPQTTDLYRLQINQTGDSARPEFIDSFEVGGRITIGDRFNLNAAAFFMAKQNFFFRDADGFNVANGKTRHVGVEADITVALTSRLKLVSALTYARHTYRFDRDVGRETEIISFGNDVDTAPRVIANTRLQWELVDRIRLEAEWISLGAYFTDAANENRYDGHNLLHLRASAEVTKNLTGYLTIRNVTDALYAERADFAFGSDRFFPGEERTIGIGLQVEY
ncbi:MAG: TonB-dependent receptor [Pseudomonadota bacterium]